MTTTLTAGAEYWLGIWSRTSTAANNWFTASNRGFSAGTTGTQEFRGLFAVASATSAQIVPGFGHHSASSAALHASVAFSHIQGSAAGEVQRFPIIAHFVSETF
jgi:hypothetical protein